MMCKDSRLLHQKIAVQPQTTCKWGGGGVLPKMHESSMYSPHLPSLLPFTIPPSPITIPHPSLHSRVSYRIFRGRGGGTPRADARGNFFVMAMPTFTETTPTLTVLWLVKPVSKVDTLLAMYRYSDLAKSADVLHQVTISCLPCQLEQLLLSVPSAR